MENHKTQNLLELARLYINTNRLERAEQTLHSILESQPDNTHGQILLAYVYRDSGRISEALQLGYSLISQEPIDAYRIIAECFLKRNQIPETIKYHEKVLELDPFNVDSRAQLINTYYSNDEISKSFAQITKACELDLNNEHLWCNIHFVSSMIEQNTVLEHKAIDKLTQLGIAFNKLLHIKAKTAQRDGLLKEAYDYLKEAYLFDPLNEEIKNAFFHFELNAEEINL